MKGLQSCECLRFLNLSYNTLTSISCLPLFQHLEEAYFSFNWLATLEFDYPETQERILPHLKLLDLTFNKIATPLHSVLPGLPSLNILAIKGNPLEAAPHPTLNSDLTSEDLINLYSDFNRVPALRKLCFSGLILVPNTNFAYGEKSN